MQLLAYFFLFQGRQSTEQHHDFPGAVRSSKAGLSSWSVSSAHEGSPSPSSSWLSSNVPAATPAAAAKFAQPAAASTASSAAASPTSSDATCSTEATPTAAATSAEGRRSLPSLSRNQTAGADVERPPGEAGQNFAAKARVVGVTRGPHSELPSLSRLRQEQPLQLFPQR